MRDRARAAAVLSIAGSIASSIALPNRSDAVPGPDSTVIVANENEPESVQLAEAYRRARNIPRSQLCLLDIFEEPDMTLEQYQRLFLEPLTACLEANGLSARIEAVMLIRGLPLRVSIPVGPTREERVSLAAALSLGRSTNAAGEPLLGMPPGEDVDCGSSTCYAARWTNLYRSGNFRPGYEVNDRDGNTYRPLLATMLNGRSYEEAALLLTSALDGEASVGARGTFLFMEGADPARAALDFQYVRVINALGTRGYTDIVRTPFDAELSGLTLASMFVGTAAIGAAVEGNTFAPGAIADNLTSFGAMPVNFTLDGELQVSIGRFVARGLAGVHGTTDEPLNNCFPSRDLLTNYVDGYTLAESYFSEMPYIYWRNLVLGDPMAAPYAKRPAVVIEGASDGETIAGARAITVRATDPESRPILSLALYAEGATVAVASDTDVLEVELSPAIDEDTELLAVAQAGGRGAQPKGWTMITVRGRQPDPPPDAGLSDSGLEDSGQPDTGLSDSGRPDTGAETMVVQPEPAESCSCSELPAAKKRGSPGAGWIALILAVIAGKRSLWPGLRRRCS